MTDGEELKKRLGLNRIERVYMARILGAGPLRTYVVAYDSRRPTFPINSAMLRGDKSPFMIRYPFDRKLRVMPLTPIEKFTFEPIGAVMLVIDLAGRYADIDKTSTFESFGGLSAIRFDETTLYDLKNAQNKVSVLTMKYRKRRTQALGPENRTAKLVDVWVEPTKDSVTLVFATPATKTPAMQTYPSDGYGLHPNLSGKYIICIEVQKFFSWVHTTPENQIVTVQDVKDTLRVADVKISSTSPSFYWQGQAWDLTQLDAAIYPVTIRPEVWGPRHNFSLLDKHTVGIINQVGFWIPMIAQIITKKLRDQGHIARPVRQRRRP
jgi:hypothetical protein